MRYSILFVLCSTFSLLNQTTHAQTAPPTDYALQYAQTITPEDLSKHLYILAGDDMEGRETAKPGQKKAAQYIANEYKSYGLPPVVNGSYTQTIPFAGEQWLENNTSLEVNGTSYQFKYDWYADNETNKSLLETTIGEVVFLGYGIDDVNYSDYKKTNVNGKTIVIYQGEPINSKGISLLTKTTERSKWNNNFRLKLEAAKKHGVKAVLFIEPNIQYYISQYAGAINSTYLSLREDTDEADNYVNNLWISPAIAKNIIGKNYKKVIKSRDRIKKSGKPRSVNLPCTLKLKMIEDGEGITGDNVLGYIEGSDPILKNELVVISAHFDHLGKRGDGIFYGADDNGSGTVTALEIAQAFAQAKTENHTPRRSILILNMSGEEKGLLGSEYYVAHPIFPLKNTIADLNVDMVGRLDEKYTKLNNPNYIYLIGADRLSTELDQIITQTNQKYTNLTLDYTFNDENDPNRFYYRSDHYNFAQKGIPAAFFFNGVHADYHRTTDTPDKINYQKMAKVGQLIFLTAWQLADQPKRIIVNKK